jgi:hypothetical protein
MGVADAWSCTQAKARGRVVGQHGARRFHLLCGICPSRVGAAAILLVPHATGVLRAPVAVPFSQLHHAGGLLRPLL